MNAFRQLLGGGGGVRVHGKVDELFLKSSNFSAPLNISYELLLVFSDMAMSEFLICWFVPLAGIVFIGILNINLIDGAICPNSGVSGILHIIE